MIYEGITRQDYNALEGINNSSLKHFKHSVKHGVYKLRNPFQQTAAMRLGTAFHTLVLEPQKFQFEYIVGGPVNSKTNKTYGSDTVKFRDWLKTQDSNKTFLSTQDSNLAELMSKATNKNKLASWYLRHSNLRECAFTWTDEETGIKCKCLIDFGSIENNFIGDLKSYSGQLDYDSLSKVLASMDYHQQYSFYMAGARANGLNPVKFINIFQQSVEELDTAVASISDNSLHYGELQYKKCLRNYGEFLNNNITGYQADEIDLDVPHWAVVDLINEEESETIAEIEAMS